MPRWLARHELPRQCGPARLLLVFWCRPQPAHGRPRTRQQVPHVLGLEAQLLQGLVAVHVAGGAYCHNVRVLSEHLGGGRRGKMCGEIAHTTRRGPGHSGHMQQARGEGTRKGASAKLALQARPAQVGGRRGASKGTEQNERAAPKTLFNTGQWYSLSAFLWKVSLRGQQGGRGGLKARESVFCRPSRRVAERSQPSHMYSLATFKPSPNTHNIHTLHAAHLIRSFSSRGAPLTGCFLNFWM